jgi:hypothetical protein
LREKVEAGAAHRERPGEVKWRSVRGGPGRQGGGLKGGSEISEEGGKGGKAHTSSTTAGSVGKSGRRKLILRWPEFLPSISVSWAQKKIRKNMDPEVNSAGFGLRKNGMDAIGVEHTGWAKVTKNTIFTLSAKRELCLDE